MKGDGERMADYVRSNAPAGISFQRVYAKPTTREDDDDDLGEHLTLQLSSTNRLKNGRLRKKTGCIRLTRLGVHLSLLVA